MSLMSPPICDFGWPAPDFSLATPNGEIHSLASSMGANGLLVMFICNHCPFVVAIAERLAEDAKAMQAEGIGVVAINSNDSAAYPADSPENMVPFAAHYGFTFPYLVDETQTVAQAYKAQCTPDFFGFNAKGKLQYRGRIDECRPGASADAIANRTPDLKNAMLQIARTGEGPREPIPSAGCSIKWKY